MIVSEPIYAEQAIESVREVRDDGLGLDGYLVIGSRINGLTCGGLRIHEDICVQELKDLAKVMELKQTFIGMPRGGSRAGIRAPISLPLERKQALMNRFAEIVREELVDRRWLVAIDVGTNIDLVHNMYRHVGVGIPGPSQEIANAGYFTALGVMKSIEVSLAIKGMKLADSRFAIEGMGNVGSHLLRILLGAGATVTAVSNVEQAIFNEAGLSLEEGLSLSPSGAETGHRDGTVRIAKEALVGLPVDVLSPCATDSTINSKNVRNVSAKIVCAGANNPVTYEAVRVLHERGILYLPDFITNAGGALGNTVKFAGLRERDLHGLLQNELVRELRKLHAESERQKRPSSEVAVELLNRKFARMKAALERKSQGNALREVALSAYRSGVIPRFIIRPLAARKITRSIGLT